MLQNFPAGNELPGRFPGEISGFFLKQAAVPLWELRPVFFCPGAIICPTRNKGGGAPAGLYRQRVCAESGGELSAPAGRGPFGRRDSPPVAPGGRGRFGGGLCRGGVSTRLLCPAWNGVEALVGSRDASLCLWPPAKHPAPGGRVLWPGAGPLRCRLRCGTPVARPGDLAGRRALLPRELFYPAAHSRRRQRGLPPVFAPAEPWAGQHLASDAGEKRSHGASVRSAGQREHPLRPGERPARPHGLLEGGTRPSACWSDGGRFCRSGGTCPAPAPVCAPPHPLSRRGSGLRTAAGHPVSNHIESSNQIWPRRLLAHTRVRRRRLRGPHRR